MSRLRITPAVAAGVAALTVAAFFIVQDQRHAWPFSRHHAVQSASATVVAPTSAASPTDAAARAAIELPDRQLEMLGVRFEPAEVRPIDEPVHGVATVAVDESRIAHVHPRIAGWLEELYVNATGQTVRAGQPLAAVFSQELYSSQKEYLAALRHAREAPASAVLEAARTRLELLGVDRAQIERLERTGEAQRLVTITAPRGGVVINRGASAGASVDPSTELMTLADLSRVWVIVELAEGDAAQVRIGDEGALHFPTARRPSFEAKVEFVYPTLSDRTRTVRVRLPVDNKDGSLRPGMYGSASFKAARREALTVARDAVVDTGDAQHVFIHTATNVIEPRTVRVGARLGDRLEILAGLTPGDHVVTSGVFLIDSESRLRASGGAGHAGHGGQSVASEGSESEAPARSGHSH